MDRLLFLMMGLSAALIVLVLFSVRRAHIRVEYSVSWLGAAISLLVISRVEPVLNWLAGVVGVDSPAVALLLIVGCVFILVFYRFSIVISGLKDANISLSQRVAILEYHLRSLNESKEGGQSQEA